MSSTRFFRFPWAASGDKTAIPDTVPPSGAVSYPQGFGPDYERDPSSDPLAKRVPRDETNQLYYDVTSNLRAWQLAALPEWVPAAQNGGVAVTYPVGAMVRHDQSGAFRNYVATVETDAEPGTSADWERQTRVQEAAGGAMFGTGGGTANAQTITTPAGYISPTGLFDGMTVRFFPSANNSGAATLNAFGLGAKPVLSYLSDALVGGELVTGRLVEVIYSSASGGRWLIVPWGADQIVPAYLSTFSRNTVTGTDVPLSGNTVLRDTLGSSTFSNGVARLTVGADGGGIWLTMCQMGAGVSGISIRHQQEVNGAMLVNSQNGGAAPFGTSITGTGLFSLKAGDTVDFIGRHQVGSTTALVGRISIFKIQGL